MDIFQGLAILIIIFLFIIGIAAAPIITIILVLFIAFSPVTFAGCSAFNNARIDSKNDKIEINNDRLATDLTHANKELKTFANSLGLKPGICASTPRYGSMVPCIVGVNNDSGSVSKVSQVFCPWDSNHYGCILSLDPQKEAPGLWNKIFEINTTSQSDSSSENFNNNFKDSNIDNFSNKVSDYAKQQSNQNNYTYEYDQNLVTDIETIRSLLEQFEYMVPSASEKEKIDFVNDETSSSLKSRIVKALRAGGESAIEEFIEPSYAKIIKSVIKGWLAKS